LLGALFDRGLLDDPFTRGARDTRRPGDRPPRARIRAGDLDPSDAIGALATAQARDAFDRARSACAWLRSCDAARARAC
jgi:hypothetical protein